MPENYRLAGGTGWCIRMQRPHWPGRVTWWASLRFRSIFRELNLFDSTDLSCARTLGRRFDRFRNRSGAFFRVRIVSVFCSDNRSFGMEIRLKGRKGNNARFRPVRATADNRSWSKRATSTVLPLFWRASVANHLTPIFNVFFLSSTSVICRHNH